jgi:hypothetical protein
MKQRALRIFVADIMLCMVFIGLAQAHLLQSEKLNP